MCCVLKILVEHLVDWSRGITSVPLKYIWWKYDHHHFWGEKFKTLKTANGKKKWVMKESWTLWCKPSANLHKLEESNNSMTLNCKLTWLSLRSRNINFYFEDQVKYSVVASLLHLEKKREICNLNKIYMGI